MEDPSGSVATRLAVDGTELWVADESPKHGNLSPESLGGDSVRMVMTVGSPEASFDRAIAAGTTEVRPVYEEYGWRLGRAVDPFGHHWEIGKPLSEARQASM